MQNLFLHRGLSHARGNQDRARAVGVGCSAVHAVQLIAESKVMIADDRAGGCGRDFRALDLQPAAGLEDPPDVAAK